MQLSLLLHFYCTAALKKWVTQLRTRDFRAQALVNVKLWYEIKRDNFIQTISWIDWIIAAEVSTEAYP